MKKQILPTLLVALLAVVSFQTNARSLAPDPIENCIYQAKVAAEEFAKAELSFLPVSEYTEIRDEVVAEVVAMAKYDRRTREWTSLEWTPFSVRYIVELVSATKGTRTVEVALDVPSCDSESAQEYFAEEEFAE